MSKSKNLTAFFLAVSYALHLQAQTATNGASVIPQPLESGQAWSSNLGFEPVGPGDLVYVSISGSPELSRSLRITDDGKLMLPLLRQGVSVVGLKPAGIEKAVTEALLKNRLLVDPIVSVAVLEYRSHRISVVGAVHMPSVFQAVGEMHLLDAIARAQGFTLDAGPELVVSAAACSECETTATRIPIKALLLGNDPSLNILLRGGEEIRVLEAPKLFIVGNVKLPGSYPLPDIDGSSVLKALALSQGVLPFSARRAYVYRLDPESGKRQEIPIELRQILHRKAPDVRLEANDIFYIPDNSGLRLTAATLDRMAGFGSTVATGLIVWR